MTVAPHRASPTRIARPAVTDVASPPQPTRPRARAAKDELIAADPKLEGYGMRYGALAGERQVESKAVWDDPVMDSATSVCWFVAALSAALAADPKLVDKCLTDNHDGTVTVRFFQYSDRYRPVYVRIGASLPARLSGGEGDAYVRCRDAKQAYAGLILKAYVAWKSALPNERDPDPGHAPIHPDGDGYAIVNQPWHAGYLLSELTGRPAVAVEIDYAASASERAAIYERLASAAKKGRAMVAVTRQALRDDAGMVVINPHHSYTVLGTVADGEHKLPCVLLRDPDGKSEPSFRDGEPIDGQADGVFAYYRGAFFANFAAVIIS